MTNCHSNPLRRLARDEARIRKQTLGSHPDQELANEGALSFFDGWNFAALMDRRGRLDDKGYMSRMLGRQFGASYKTRREWPFIEAALKAYRTRRAKASHPLRFKKEHRLKTIPAVGFLGVGIDDVLRNEGIHPQNVVSKRIRRSGRAWVINITRQAPKQEPIETARRIYQRVKNRARVQLAGVSVTQSGVTVVRFNNPQRWNSRRTVTVNHFSATEASQPGFVRELFRRLFSNVHMVGLDVSSSPTLPGALLSVTTELRRWGRSRQAAGATGFGMASPLWQEAQETMEYAKSVGFNTTDLRSALRDARDTSILKCPHCGALVALKLNHQTQVPEEGATTCSDCQAVVSVGLLLATRSAAFAQDGWLHFGGAPRPKGPDRHETAPKRKTTTSYSRNRSGKASAARPTRVNPVIESELDV